MTALPVDPRVKSSDFKIVLTGLGGQGVIFATRVLAQAALVSGRDVLASETHGMSQRGGSVLSHLKIDGSEAPLIRRGTADLVIGLDRDEGLRCLPFLRSGGAVLINASDGLPARLEEILLDAGCSAHVIPAAEEAAGLASPMLANAITLGYAAAANLMPLSLDDLKRGLEAMGPRNYEANLEALAAGERAATRSNGSAARRAQEGGRL